MSGTEAVAHALAGSTGGKAKEQTGVRHWP